MDQEIRNKLRNVVTRCRKLLEDDTRDALEGKFGIFAKKDQVTADPNATMTHLGEEEQAARKDILDHFAHIQARGFKPKDALDQLVREVAFTHLNRLCAYKMMEAREVYVDGAKFREAVSRGVNSNAVKFYLADHAEDERLYNTGHQDVAYRHFLDWLGGMLSDEIGVLFNPNDPANRLYPRQKTLDEVLDLLNGGGIKAEETELRKAWPEIWSQDETIGWVYQYFTPKELRDQARKESQAPRNSYELAFRNQFFTPRYVVEFLTDNTLGRIWYEMRQGDTRLKDECRYMVRRPTEIFLKEGEQPPKDAAGDRDDLSQEELLKLPVYIPHRPKKDPRELKILDPACGSGHFLLYCFDLLLTIYEEAYADPDLGPALQKDYPKLDDLRQDVPRLILAHNLHGIDIDLRASQIAALALWLRCQRAYQNMGLKKDRPKITRSNFVCAEPMPGEAQMLKEFVGQLEPKVLGQIVEVVFDKMKLAGEAGSLLKIEEEIRGAVAAAKAQYVRETTRAMDRKGQMFLFSEAELDRLAGKPEQISLFDLSDITDEQFFEEAEARVIEALRSYAEQARDGERFQRRLFTEDAVRGFAFVDLCQKQYDVVLMNPPFGTSSLNTKSYVDAIYPEGKNDLYGAFVQFGALRVIHRKGFVGAITSRAFLAGRHMRRFRNFLLPPPESGQDARLEFLLDLGPNILDEAMVEATCYIVSTSAKNPLGFADLRKQPRPNLQASVPQSANAWRWLQPAFFNLIPMRQFLYNLSKDQIASLNSGRTIEPNIGRVTKGLSTCSDERFVRCFWEVPQDSLFDRWFPLAKGGDYSWLTGTLHLVIDYEDDGKRLADFNAAIDGNVARSRQSSRYYFRPAATWSRRSNKGFSARRLRAKCVFGDKSPVVVPKQPNDLAWIAPIFMSSVYHDLIEEQAKFGSYETACVKSLPVPNNHIRSAAADWTPIYTEIDNAERGDDTSWLFESVRYSDTPPSSFIARAIYLVEDMLSKHGFSISDEVKALCLTDIENERCCISTIKISCCIGYIFGRFDIRVAIGIQDAMKVADPFAPLPRLCPGALRDTIDKPALSSPNNYPLHINWDGILVDDPDHSDDILKRTRDVFEVIWTNQVDTIEKEICERIGVKALLDYFRKPGKGGFWDDHISRYSKSRRKAPIYWLLQSSKKNYALWL
jgi:hypothetical protein